MCLVSKGIRKGRSLELEMVVSHHVEAWNLNLGPLQLQQGLMSAGRSGPQA